MTRAARPGVRPVAPATSTNRATTGTARNIARVRVRARARGGTATSTNPLRFLPDTGVRSWERKGSVPVQRPSPDQVTAEYYSFARCDRRVWTAAGQLGRGSAAGHRRQHLDLRCGSHRRLQTGQPPAVLAVHIDVHVPPEAPALVADAAFEPR